MTHSHSFGIRARRSLALLPALLLLTCSLTVLSPGSAAAETRITLGQAAGFGALKQFYNIPNDSGQTINMTFSTSYPSIYLTIGDLPCSAPAGDPAYATLIDNAQVTCADGSWAVLNIEFHYTRRYVSSGRAHYYVTSWVLDGGTIDRP